MLRLKWVINVLRALWVIVLVNNELIVFLTTAKQCSTPSNNKIMLIADPQITDDMSYQQSPLLMSFIKFYSALYMKRNYKHLINTIQPNEIFFLGDLMDNGREWDNAKYSSEVKRFYSIFNSEKEKHHYMVGNHDIGFHHDNQTQLLERFQSYFGNTSYIYTYNGYAIIVLDTISLMNIKEKPENSIQALDILNSELLHMPRLLMTHVPLYRPSDVSCGQHRQKINTVITNEFGYQYQNLLSPELSDLILNKMKPIAIFSGDDHDYCKVTHTYSNQTAVEMTVPTFSMAQGLKEPGVMILDVSDTTLLKTELCWLPNQINIFLQYAYMLAFTIITLVVYHVWQLFKSKKGYSLLVLHKEQLLPIENKSLVISFFISIKDIAIVGIPTYIACILIF